MRLICVALLLSALAFSQIDPKRFAIMAWEASPSDETQLRGMRDAGLNISGFCQPGDLEKVRAEGLVCFVKSPALQRIDWNNLPSDAELQSQVATVRSQIAGNPAVLGVFLDDEPNAALMPSLGKVSKMLRDAMPGVWTYLNVFPLNASPDRIGTRDYDSYLRSAMQTVQQPFLSYDNYSLIGGLMQDSFYTNLEAARRVSLAAKTPFWDCVLANAHTTYMEPSDATFNLQVYASLAYGSRGIEYFTYFAPTAGNFRLAPVDQFGNRTPTWDMLRRINNQLRMLAPTLVRLKSTGVFHTPNVPPQGQPLSASRLIESIDLSAPTVRTAVSGNFLIGEFEDENGQPYFMLVNKDLNNSYRASVHLRKPGAKLWQVSEFTGKEVEFAGIREWIAPGAGVLVRIGDAK